LSGIIYAVDWIARTDLFHLNPTPTRGKFASRDTRGSDSDTGFRLGNFAICLSPMDDYLYGKVTEERKREINLGKFIVGN